MIENIVYNRYSYTLTNNECLPAAMLDATGRQDFDEPRIVSNWYEGYPDHVALNIFSGGTHGFVVGHITPEAKSGGVIPLIKDKEIIKTDSIKHIIPL